MISTTVTTKGGPGSARYPKGSAAENKKQALERLALLPSDHSCTGAPRKNSVSFTEVFHSINELPPYTDEKCKSTCVESIDICKACATQTGGKRSAVEKFINDPALAYGEGNECKPTIVRKGGVDYVHDGHHRILANILLGNESLPVYLISLD